MKLSITTLLLLFTTTAFAQLEVSTGYGINKNDAKGLAVNLAYDFQVKNRLYTKSQIGYKKLHRYNDYVGANLDVSIGEIHQTMSYEIIHNKKFILKPNIGLNYRFYKWTGKVAPPYNTLPQRAWVIGVRDQKFILNSFDDGFYREYKVNNLGFSFQLQNQFRLTEMVWLHVTPFIEPDYDKSQNTGGCYIGIILKSL